ncbi:MFS transporter [Rhodobium gokarnense]|uniref:MFS family permease n=1 Tax=Rhodobium gokarnense TaxID=364296 RepID=A0ABT3HA45_9HYPH|nr:MFS transporter [Rhodobium gokarnense]MCW2307272.1 MFS family permease [Rhodobium gokarnense]
MAERSVQGAASRPVDRRGMAAAIASISTVGVAISLSMPLLALVMEARGFSGTAIGINSAMAGVSSIFWVPFVAPLARRIGTARLILILIAASMASFLGFFVISSYWAWFGLRFVFHGATTAIFVLSEFWISSAAPSEKRGFILGVYATFLSIGVAAGPIVLSVTGSEGALPFLIGTLILALSAIPVVMARETSPRIEKKPGQPFAKFLLAVPAATIAVLAFGAVETGMLSILPIYGLRIGLDAATATLLVTAAALGNVALQVPLGWMSDRMDKRVLLLICGLIGVVGALLIPVFADTMSALFVTLFVWGGVTAGLYTIGLAHLAARYRDADLAAATAAFVMMYSIGMLVGPALMGIGMDINPHGFPIVCALFFGGYVAIAGFRIARWAGR